jgi:thioredoxin 1
MNSLSIKIRPLIILLFAICLISSCTNSESSDKNIVTVTSDNFDQTINKGVVLVDFWATWCRPCQIQGPIVAELAGKYKNKLIVGKIDIDQNRDLAGTYDIQSIPTLMIFVNGKPVETLVGLRSKEALEELINKYTQK